MRILLDVGKNKEKFKFKDNIIIENGDIFKNIKEKNVDIILTDKNHFFLSKIAKYFYKIPIINVNKEDINEKYLQNKIAYLRQKDIPVLMYHRVINSSSEAGTYDTYVTKENFDKQMKYLKENDYEIITFKEMDKINYKNRFDKKYVIITFDDGYKDNYINAVPILKKYGIKVVLFYVTDLNFNRWDVEVKTREKEKRFELMTYDEIKEIYDMGLLEIGGHTTCHLDMPNFTYDYLKKDLEEANKKLEKITNEKIISFAYPWGNNNEICRKVVSDMGYKYAVSVETGTSCFSDDLYEIQRVGIYSTDDMAKFIKKASGNYPFMRENRANRKKFRNKLRKLFGLKTK